MTPHADASRSRARWRALAAALVLSAVTSPLPGQQERPVPAEEPLSARPAPIVQGVLDHGSPSVGLFLGGGRLCTATLIGCRSVLTAAHCICRGGGGAVLTGAECRRRPELVDPSNKFVFFQHAGAFGASEVKIHPDFLFEARSDLALLRLSEPVPGVRPSRINQEGRPAHGSAGVIVGFGSAGGAARDLGLKRAGAIRTVPCRSVPDETHLCWDFETPLGAPGEDSNTCRGDSGGPLFMDLGAGTVVTGVTSGGDSFSCLPPDHAYDADVFVERAWIRSAAGPDLHRTDCGTLPLAGEPEAPILTASGTLSGDRPDLRFDFEVPPGTERLVASINGAIETLDADLYLRHLLPPTLESADCSRTNPFSLEICTIESPSSGTWHLLAHGTGGTGELQATVTLFGATDGDPPPPPGPWLSSDALPGFEAKVLIDGSIPGSRETVCIPESLCVSGALAGRPEVFVKVIGPRPNGFLWTQISRFTPAAVEIWLRQTSTGQVNYYVLEHVGPNRDDVSGLQDRQAFAPR